MEYVNLLRANARTKGKPWDVTLRSPEDAKKIEDAAVIEQYYAAKKRELSDERFTHITFEASDLAEHVFKIPSCLTF